MEGVIYNKEYAEKDIRKEIHSKMDLQDVYAAFEQSRTND